MKIDLPIFFTKGFALTSVILMTGCENVAPKNSSTNSSGDLQKLTVTLDSADSQTEMNIASAKISEDWDARLTTVERRLKEYLDALERVQFAKSEKQWRGFRLHEVRFQASRYAGGSVHHWCGIRPIQKSPNIGWKNSNLSSSNCPRPGKLQPNDEGDACR